MSERVLEIGTQKHTKIVCLDRPSYGGACHAYKIYKQGKSPLYDGLCLIEFQKGPVKELGVNGCHNEDLIAIVIDRIRHFQEGGYFCHENALALDKLEEALMWLRKRTTDRENRGVEGTSKK